MVLELHHGGVAEVRCYEVGTAKSHPWDVGQGRLEEERPGGNTDVLASSVKVKYPGGTAGAARKAQGGGPDHGRQSSPGRAVFWDILSTAKPARPLLPRTTSRLSSSRWARSEAGR